NAQKEAELILKDAQLRADKYVDQSRNMVHQLESELMSLKTQRDSFLVRFRSMLRDQLSLLQVISENLDDKRLERMLSEEMVPAEMNQNPKVFEEETLDELPPEPIV
ncbi:MAG: DivIVA domain-containing protein, partial [Chitinivibrionales bacterium]|nr:DivIVA domain-containing protein [Chitinivibrionales bacterium]